MTCKHRDFMVIAKHKIIASTMVNAKCKALQAP